MNVLRTVVGLCVVCCLAAGGCAEEENKPRIVELPGTVESIDLQERTVIVKGFSEKHEQPFEEKVYVTGETELMINGVLSRLEDVQIGETAVGTVKIVKDAETGAKRCMALRVEIERAEAIVAPGAKENGG